MTTAQVVETSVTVNNNSPIQDHVHPDDQTQPTFEMTPGFKPFTICYGLIGQFVNAKGGKGNNYANDLKMEHIVRNDKGILKGMCRNKALKAVQRSTSPSFLLNEIVKQYDSNIAPESTAHTHGCTCDDVRERINIISGKNPFDFNQEETLTAFLSFQQAR